VRGIHAGLEGSEVLGILLLKICPNLKIIIFIKIEINHIFY